MVRYCGRCGEYGHLRKKCPLKRHDEKADRFKYGPRDRRLIDRLPIEMWQTALSYLRITDILPNVPRCCRFLRECVWGPWSAALLWREIGIETSNILAIAASELAPIAHIRTLIAGGAGINNPPTSSLYAACAVKRQHDDPIRRVEIVQTLLDARANINEISSTYHWTPLMEACYYNNHEVVQLLISRNANVNILNGAVYTALMAASIRGHASVISTLLDARADITTRNNSGRTALDEAILYSRHEVVHLLQAQNPPAQ